MSAVAESTEVTIDSIIRRRLDVYDMSPREVEDCVRDLFPSDALVVAQEIPVGSKHRKSGHLEIQVVRLTNGGVTTTRHYFSK